MEYNKVILIGGDHYNGLSLVRLFGKYGFHPYGIIMGCNYKDSFLANSKYWTKVWFVKTDSEILDVLERNFTEEKFKPVIIPWSDGAAATVDNNLYRLCKNFICPSIGMQQSRLYQMMDKGKQVAFAHACGLTIAESHEFDLNSDYSIENIKMPCIGKPIVSCEGDKKDIKKIDSIQELSDYLAHLKYKGYRRILIQEYINIEREFDVEGFIDSNESVYYASEKVRTWPNVGGSTSFSFSVDNPNLNKEMDKIVNHLKNMHFSGLFDVELFRIGDSFLFNEINWRNSAMCFAAVASGVYYPLYWYLAVTGQECFIEKPKRYNRYAMVELLDFQHVKNKEISIMKWLKDYKLCSAKAYYDHDDMAPIKKRAALFLKHRTGRQLKKRCYTKI